MNESQCPVLLVEDNPDDVLIVKRAWREAEIENDLMVVNDGEQAVRFLQKGKPYDDAPTPMLILLDLKMPRMDGFDVLKVIKGDRRLRSIPVVVLTSLEISMDIERAYDYGCNSYIVKPTSFAQFQRAIKKLKHYWMYICKTPMTI